MAKFSLVAIAGLVLLAGGVPGAAMAQSAGCASEPREVSLYFERDKPELNDFSKALVDRLANDAKNCGLTQVVAEAKLDAKRAAVIADTFQSRGVKMVLLGAPTAAVAGEEIAARTAKLRVTMASRKG